ncbi:MAG: hypothetical protein HKP36_13995 [Myxococcales bacterium]|nr:hypothetical protein [Deltaproteobacteria bacterium]MBT8482691.1 hypothetical protein [Deltaproteobacteria bacterium]NNL25552.1 hypothetical protein [Myxococcales bacterium]RZV52129.1 MAG: hypothetical protein EX268_12780 [Deltaproteobacteria bacterium]
MKIRFAFLLLIVGAVATVSSCTKRPLANLNPCTINGVVQNVPVNPQRALDLLILIDDSPSMRDEQDKLAEQVPRLVNLLLTGGVDTDGVSMPVGDFPAVESLHVAVITPDLGYSTEPPTNFTPGVDFNPTNACTSTGKAGFMQVTGLAGTPLECTAQTPPAGTLYLNYPEPPFSQADFIDDVTCVTGQADGCGFEQQLEAILASDRNTANGGFSRDDALLAVILITDEDDCSTTDPRIFDVEARPSNPYQGPFADPPTNSLVQFNLRCSAHKTALQAIQRYVDGIANLKSDPSQVVFAAITGIPEDSALDPENFNTDADRYAAILDHPGMEEVPDPASDGQQDQALTPACIAGDGSGAAAPGVRIVETVEGLAISNTGVGTVVESICADDYAPALNAIVDRIAAALRQLCLPRPLNRTAQNIVNCEVREVQPAGTDCDEERGRVLIGTEDVGSQGSADVRNVCRITQLPSDPTAGIPTGLGWFYDDFTAETASACSFNPEQQRVSFTEGAAPITGARVRFECLQTAPPQDVDVGWPCTSDAQCDPNPDNCLEGEAVTTAECEADPANCCETRLLKERYDRDNLELVCDNQTNTCQLTCESNVQCPGGYACFDENEDGSSYCVNPTCTLN